MQASPKNNHAYNGHLQPFANKLRKEMTKAEACMWKYALRAGQMKGYQFRRQRPVLNYIADFMCKELMLVIEVDGITHQCSEVFKKDMIRQKEIEEAGFTVLRFTYDDVLKNLGGVFTFIQQWINEYEISHPGLISPQRYRDRKD